MSDSMRPRDDDPVPPCMDFDNPGPHVWSWKFCRNCGKREPVEAIRDDYAEMAALRSGWDSHGASSIDPKAIEAAKAFEAAINRVPCTSGGVQFEWHTHGVDLEIDFRHDGTVASVFAKNARTGEYVELEVPIGE